MYFLNRYCATRRIEIACIAMFFRQFATLYRAGITLTTCGEILEKNQTHPRLSLIIHAITCHLRAGHTLQESLMQHKPIFDELTCHLVHIGEETGTLDQALARLANHHEHQSQLKQQWQQALFYPGIVLIVACFMTLALLIFIIPKFAVLLAAHIEKLPLITRYLFAFADFLHAHLLSLGLGISLMIVAILYAHTRGYLQTVPARIWSGLPLIRHFIRVKEQAYFARYLALCLAAGLPLTTGLRLIIHHHQRQNSTTNLYMLLASVHAGMPLHHAMAKHPLFTPLMIQMSKIGEEAGMLDHMLDKCADILDMQLAQMLARGLQLLEPLIMLGLGALIGGLLIAIYLPLFNLGNAF